MGVCSSCLNPERHSQAQPPDEENQALLTGNGNAQYGGVAASDGAIAAATERARARAREAEPDPETLKKEREEMDRICQGLARKLIDVSAQARASSNPNQAENASTVNPSTATTAPTRPNFSALFDATFTQHNSADAIPSLQQSRPIEQNADGNSHTAPPHEDREANTLEAQKQWLKDIMGADTVERRWDWTTVRKVDGPFTISFDDF